MDTLLRHQIGSHAGIVYRVLVDNPGSTASAVRKVTGLNNREVDMALGWLAHEAKLTCERDGRMTRYTVT